MRRVRVASESDHLKAVVESELWRSPETGNSPLGLLHVDIPFAPDDYFP